MKTSVFLIMKEANPLRSSLMSSALPALRCRAPSRLSGGRKLAVSIDGVQQGKPATRETSLLTFVVQWFVIGTVGGAEPEVCALHFDFEKVFRKMIVYCIQFAA